MSEYVVVDPASGAKGTPVPLATDEELEASLAGAQAAGGTWGRTFSVTERSALLGHVADLHEERREQLAAAIVREMGKPIDQALIEIDLSADIYRHFALTAPEQLADREIALRSGTGRAFVRSAPIGVILGIMPWNYPVYQVARFAAPNLAIGNTIVLKHAPQCPDSAALVERIFRDAGLPEGAYINIYASNGQVASLIADPRIAGVSLTGSERAGAAVAELAGRHLKKVVLELGGSDPFIVLGADDLDRVVAAAVSARMENTGQACNAAKRFLVVDELYDQFADAFQAALLGIAPSDPAIAGAEAGPLSSSLAADRLEEQVERAVAHGATAARNRAREGTWFPPVLLTDVDASNPARNEEFFGPVAMLFRVADEAEAIALANDTPYGLGSYVFTNDPEQAIRVADALEVGMVFINVVAAEAAELPFGGVKRSGFGRELGALAFDEFTNHKTIRIG